MYRRNLIYLLITLLILNACRKNPTITDTYIDPVVYNPDWSLNSHGNVSPDYTSVFPQDSVNKIEITIGSDKWNSIRSNMTSLYGYDFGTGTGGPGPGGFPTEEPAYVDVTLKFKNLTWKNVGFRLKGNSSLSMAWRTGNYKLPFRLNFDKFEDQYPGIKNQHFYGFEELSFSPGAKDQSLIREKMTSDIFRLAGMPSPQSSFYRVYVDIGTGLKYWGLYCGLELPDDNMIKNQLGEESGNMYKPESKLANFVQTEFEKKNNDAIPDYSDVQQFVAALNSNTRTSNPDLWKQNLEAVFNVDHFLKWLAINNAIVNWDTYGLMAHNYYLYNHSTNKLLWLPWDNNEALSRSPGIAGTAGTPPGPGASNALSLSMNEVTATWPLIRYLADDAIYFQRYKDHLKTFNLNTLDLNTLNSKIDQYYSLITPYVIGVNGEQTGYTYITSSSSFNNEKTNLKTHLYNRKTLLTTFVP